MAMWCTPATMNVRSTAHAPAGPLANARVRMRRDVAPLQRATIRPQGEAAAQGIRECRARAIQELLAREPLGHRHAQRHARVLGVHGQRDLHSIGEPGHFGMRVRDSVRRGGTGHESDQARQQHKCAGAAEPPWR